MATQLGVGGVIAVLVIGQVLAFLKGRTTNGKFVYRDVCVERHKAIETILYEVKADVKTLLRNRFPGGKTE